ncbi:hypothetical protein [Gilvimarinus sp. 1_MG-2023]|uniref:hypothetical protein n=1 Tax=Gilvimarinus sp. 1_MG-2023 TaxID=3062638 RepID=UPI0026E363AE|nr:hypothetical protein [Gilvimarinus sp. 1_MG-2023]MDO6747621.1 hypothetical protein [Gilvimarinus sp. 1_MG-2023]
MKALKLGLLALGLLTTSVHAAVVVTHTNLTTVEDDGTTQYKVVLDSPPAAAEIVTITPTSNDVTEGTVSSALNFDASNWDTPQYVSVTPGASGDGNDGNVMYNIGNAITVTNPSAYVDSPGTDVTVTNINIEGISTIIVYSPSLLTSEGGSTKLVVIRAIGGPPTDEITLPFSTASTEILLGSVSPLVLNAGNLYETVLSVAPQDDNIADGDQPFSIVFSPTTSSDLTYNDISPNNVSGLNQDNDIASIIVAPNSGVTVTEGGAWQTIAVAASSATPTADVTVNLTPSAEVTTSVGSVVLNASNGYRTTFDITAVDDVVVDGDLAFTVTTAAATSSDAAFAGLDPDDVTGTAADNDTPAVAATPLPTMGHFGQFILMMLLAGFGTRVLRKRR